MPFRPVPRRTRRQRRNNEVQLSAHQFKATRRMGLSATDAAGHDFEARRVEGQSARGWIRRIRRQLIDLARSRHRLDLVALLESAASLRTQAAEAVAHAIGGLRPLPASAPLIGNEVVAWLAPRGRSTVGRGHQHLGRPDRLHSSPASLVDGHFWAGCCRREADRSLLRSASPPPEADCRNPMPSGNIGSAPTVLGACGGESVNTTTRAKKLCQRGLSADFDCRFKGTVSTSAARGQGPRRTA